MPGLTASLRWRLSATSLIEIEFKMKTLIELQELWDRLGDTPIDSRDCIEVSFLHFPVGTNRYEIWYWFEEQNPEFSVTARLEGR